MSTQPESRLQRRVRAALKEEWPDSWWFKVHGGPFQRAGIPDILGCLGGQFFGFETKTPEGKGPTPIQNYEMGKIATAGGIIAVIRRPIEVISVVRQAISLPKDCC